MLMLCYVMCRFNASPAGVLSLFAATDGLKVTSPPAVAAPCHIGEVKNMRRVGTCERFL